MKDELFIKLINIGVTIVFISGVIALLFAWVWCIPLISFISRLICCIGYCLLLITLVIGSSFIKNKE